MAKVHDSLIILKDCLVALEGKSKALKEAYETYKSLMINIDDEIFLIDRIMSNIKSALPEEIINIEKHLHVFKDNESSNEE